MNAHAKDHAMPPAKIAPCLWFDGQAEEAANHYVAIFPGARILSVSRYGPGMPFPAGTALVAEFEIAGQRFQALNGGPHFKFTEAISLSVDCADQAEVDDLWDKLVAGGSPGRCGWLKDRYGVSWQIVPSGLGRLMGSGDGRRIGAMMQAFMSMNKIDIVALEAAYNAA